MELREFVAESLKHIVDGISEAQKYAKEKGAVINPVGIEYDEQFNKKVEGLIVRDEAENYHIPQIIDFDIVITVSEGEKTKAGLAVFTGVLGMGAQAQLEGENVVANKIKFSVPILLPEQKVRLKPT